MNSNSGESTIAAAAKAAQVGNAILSVFAGAGLVAMLLVGGYVIWYTVMVYRSAFLGDDLLQYKPVLDDDPTNPSLYELMKINPDVCAWITVDGTNIDYPIVQGKDNLEYLSKDIYGKFSLAGSVFVDYKCARDFTDPYSVIYGHHMENGSVFSQVIDFQKKKYFEEHPTGILFLPDTTYAISFFASIEANGYDSKVLTIHKKKEAMPALLSYVQQKSIQQRTLKPALTAKDTVISLVTCEDANTDGRAMLFGRLDPIKYVKQGTDDENEKKKTEQEWFEEENP